jgi:hypothetical protein
MKWLFVFCLGCEKYVAAPTVSRSVVDESQRTAPFNSPWPDDRVLNADGTFPASLFPVANGGTLVQTLLTTGDHLVKGWGLAAPIYVPFSGSLDPSTLTADSVQLVVVDPSSPYNGQRAKVDWRFVDEVTTYLPGHVLAVRPLPGFPLEPKTRYALYVTTAVHDAKGKAVGPDAALFAALTGTGDADNRAFYAPLVALFAREKSDVTKIAAATIFTTQPVLDELFALRDFLTAQSDPQPQDVAVFSPLSPPPTDFDVFTGTYSAPNLQHGTPPYLEAGGDFQYDAAGQPTVAQVEQMSFTVCVPKGDVPPGGFPLVIYSHGTGGDYTSVIGDIADDLALRGVASVGIDQVLADHRIQSFASTTGCFGNESDYCFFNPINAQAGRNNSRQAALDNVTLRKMLAHLTVPAAIAGRDVTFSLDHVGFFGHSQGGLTGAIYTAADSTLAGSVLSGAGGYITETVLVRTTPLDLMTLVRLVINVPASETIDEFHPVLGLLQTLAEVSDPLNYARYWLARPTGAAKNLYVTSGLLDEDVPPIGAAWMAAAGGVPPVAPLFAFSDVFAAVGLSPIARPVQSNVAGVTAVFRQFQNQDHFAAFDDPSARVDWSTFLSAVVHTGTGVIP